uniref:ATP synthase F0 subunit 8 n=1 Tax=Euborellia arcanum TaxID=1610841 RepID=A0A1J0M4C3_9NEOP|nr:ATP synthase F0 subunit 8 [Euborellia arcanum]APD14846.1 ATP synthase F0 subunit 8 [Euborellia arcanum]
MPQMAPLSWLMMYFFFLLVYIIFLSVVHFMNSGLSDKSEFYTVKEESLNPGLSWKW